MHPPRKNVIETPPQPPMNTCRTGSPSVTSPRTTMPPTTRGDAAHCPCSGHHPKAPSRWGGILPGTVALTYLCLPDAGTHTQPSGTQLLLTLEGEATVENVHTAEEEDYVTANADTAVWLHAHKHTTPPTVVPGSHPWHVVIVRLPTGAGSGSAQQGWADRWAHVCASLHDGLHRPSLTSHTLERAPATAESHTAPPPPPHRSLGLHTPPPPRGSGSPQDPHLQPLGPRTPPPR